jgi:hypothetical protein
MKVSNRTLLIVVLAYIFLLLVQNAYLFIRIQEYSSAADITARASGDVRFCYNHPPRINNTCVQEVYQDEEFYCRMNVTDPDSSMFTYDLSIMSPSYAYGLFGITQTGLIRFTPNATQVANYTFRVTVWDNSMCLNNLDSGTYQLRVINVNDPPYLVEPIPNQTWLQDTSLSPFNLDNYFDDYDNDPLTYTYTYPQNIIVLIDEDNSVTFVPRPNFYGYEDIIFFAWDPYLANGSSNVVRLTVMPRGSIPPEAPPRSSGGTSSSYPVCIPRWYCTPWGRCHPEGIRYRDCHDLNNCTIPVNKPDTTEPCEFISTCYDGFQGPDEEGIDCGGPCPPCGTCYDSICNNEEDCTRGLTHIPDCGGPCMPCEYPKPESCYDGICNNDEDCTRGLTHIPDCGGPCEPCPTLETPAYVKAFNWALMVIVLLMIMFSLYLLKQSYPSMAAMVKKKKRRYYEQRLLLETKVSESLFESLTKIENLLSKEDIQKLILLFSIVVRKYFKSLFDLKYEFTYEELMNEIDSRKLSPTFKSVMKKFFERSIEMDFSGKTVSEQELRAMLSEFKQIVSFTSEEPLLEDKKAKTQTKPRNKVDALFANITEAESCLRRQDLNSAYFKYVAISHDFNSLSSEDKQKLHGFISRLYEEIKLAREKYEFENT